MSQEKENDGLVVVYMRVSQDMNDDMERIKDKYGMSKSAISSLCAGIGLTYLKALTDPESLLTTKKMAEVVLEAESLEKARALIDEKDK
jgi:hypothetical protein